MPGRDVSGLGRVGKRKRGEPRLARIPSLAGRARPCRKAVSSPRLLVQSALGRPARSLASELRICAYGQARKDIATAMPISICIG